MRPRLPYRTSCGAHSQMRLHHRKMFDALLEGIQDKYAFRASSPLSLVVFQMQHVILQSWR